MPEITNNYDDVNPLHQLPQGFPEKHYGFFLQLHANLSDKAQQENIWCPLLCDIPDENDAVYLEQASLADKQRINDKVTSNQTLLQWLEKKHGSPDPTTWRLAADDTSEMQRFSVNVFSSTEINRWAEQQAGNKTPLSELSTIDFLERLLQKRYPPIYKPLYDPITGYIQLDNNGKPKYEKFKRVFKDPVQQEPSIAVVNVPNNIAEFYSRNLHTPFLLHLIDVQDYSAAIRYFQHILSLHRLRACITLGNPDDAGYSFLQIAVKQAMTPEHQEFFRQLLSIIQQSHSQHFDLHDYLLRTPIPKDGKTVIDYLVPAQGAATLHKTPANQLLQSLLVLLEPPRAFQAISSYLNYGSALIVKFTDTLFKSAPLTMQKPVFYTAASVTQDGNTLANRKQSSDIR